MTSSLERTGVTENLPGFGQACNLFTDSNEAMVDCKQLGCTAEGTERVNANRQVDRQSCPEMHVQEFRG